MPVRLTAKSKVCATDGPSQIAYSEDDAYQIDEVLRSSFS